MDSMGGLISVEIDGDVRLPREVIARPPLHCYLFEIG